MSEDEILEGIAQVAHRQLAWRGPLEPGMRLLEELELDSLRRLALAVEIENKFRICLDDEEADLVTVGDLVKAIARQLQARQTEGRRR